MNPLKLLPILLLLALALGACGSSTSTSSEAAPPMMSGSSSGGAPVQKPGGDMANAPPAGEADGSGSVTLPSEPPLVRQQTERLVIRDAQVTLEVDNVGDAESRLRDRVAQLSGYIVSAQTNGSDVNLYTQITFRVPSQRFDEALGGVEGLARKVLSRHISGTDVTEEFVDLESRLRNLEATRERLLALLEQADEVGDALLVNNALTDVQGQIEQTRGRMQYLEQSAAMSTITVTLQPVPVAVPLIEEGWQPATVAREALRGLVGFGQGLASIVIVALVWTPVWLPLLLLALWARRRLRNRGAAPTNSTPSAQG